MPVNPPWRRWICRFWVIGRMPRSRWDCWRSGCPRPTTAWRMSSSLRGSRSHRQRERSGKRKRSGRRRWRGSCGRETGGSDEAGRFRCLGVMVFVTHAVTHTVTHSGRNSIFFSLRNVRVPAYLAGTLNQFNGLIKRGNDSETNSVVLWLYF